MIDVPPGATTVPPPTNIDLNDVMRNHPLIADFPPLPSRDLIVAASQQPPPNSGPSTFPILPVIDLLGGGINLGPRGNHRNPPGRSAPPAPTPGTVTGRGQGAGPNKGPSTPPPVYTSQPPGHTKVPPGTTRTQNVPQPSPPPKKRPVKKPKPSNPPGGLR
jgi:hypothetical protein